MLSSIISAKKLALYVAMISLCLQAVLATNATGPNGEIITRSVKKQTGPKLISFTFLASIILIALSLFMIFASTNILGDGVNGGNVNIFGDNGASLYMRLAVIIPSGLFVVGALVAFIHRTKKYNEVSSESNVTFQDWKKSTDKWYAIAWFLSLIVLAVVFVNSGGNHEFAHKAMFQFAWIGLLAVGLVGGLTTTIFLTTMSTKDDESKSKEVGWEGDNKSSKNYYTSLVKANQTQPYFDYSEYKRIQPLVDPLKNYVDNNDYARIQEIASEDLPQDLQQHHFAPANTEHAEVDPNFWATRFPGLCGLDSGTSDENGSRRRMTGTERRLRHLLA